MRRIVSIAGVLVALVGACSSGSGDKTAETVASIATTVESTTTRRGPSTTTTTAPPPLTMPSGDPVFEGFPRLVETSSVDHRVANWASGPQLVALAPGVYTDYNPNIPDLTKYLDQPNFGDCAMRDEYFSGTGGACWTGVQ